MRVLDTAAQPPIGEPHAGDGRGGTLVGVRLQQLRGQRGLSIRKLATESNLTASFISQVERGLAQPSVSSLARLTAALGVSLPDFFRTSSPAPNRLIRREDRVLRSFAGMHEELITPTATEQLQVAWWTFEPGGGSGDELVADAPGEECILVVDGQLEVAVGVERYLLRTGDSLTFQCATPHRIHNMAPRSAVALIAHAPPHF